MSSLRLVVISLRYSSWSMRPWLVLTHAGAKLVTETVTPDLKRQGLAADDDAALVKIADREIQERRTIGSVTGLFPVLYVDGVPVHESLAICEWVNDAFPEARLWPDSALDRAQARALACEMATSFTNMRTQMSCHLFGRVPAFTPSPATQRDIDRVLELWRGALDRSGGPLHCSVGSASPTRCSSWRKRFRTYGVEVPR